MPPPLPPHPATVVGRIKFAPFCGVIVLLQHAVHPVHTSEHNLSFIHHFRDHFPDPEQIFYTLHAKLWAEEDRGKKQSGMQSSKSE